MDFAQLEEIQALLPKFLALPKGKILTVRMHAGSNCISHSGANSIALKEYARVRKGAQMVCPTETRGVHTSLSFRA